MVVSQNPTLNILIAKENKALETVLKEADTKTLQNMVQNKSSSPADVLKNLFEQAKSGAKSNTNIESMLKNSSAFKDLGSFSSSTSTLLDQIDEDSNLSKFKPLLQNFLKNMNSLDENTLKEQINKSGVFLESKIAQNSSNNSSLPNKVEQLLNQIQNITKGLNTTQAKVVNDLITKLTQNTNSNSDQLTNMKTLLTSLQDLSNSLSNKTTQNLSNLTNQLSSMIDKASLIESKLQNTNSNQLLDNKNTINNQAKELLSQIKNEVLGNNPSNQTKNLLSQIDTLIKTNDLFAKNDKLIEPKVLLNQLMNSSDIKNASNLNSNISSLVLNLKNITNDINNLEQKVLNSQSIVNDKASLIDNLKQNLSQLKLELSNMSGLDSKAANQMISKLENITTLFSKIDNPISNLQSNIASNISTFTSNFSSNLNTLLMSMKEDITNLATNQNNNNAQNNLLKAIDKIEVILKENIINPNTQMISKNETNPLSSDMKSILLQMSDELASKTDAKSQEMFKQVDKMITQIDYHQLLSHTGNSNSVYVPFLWDMLEDGSINMKKTDEEKFYCQINLTLKDFGKVDLMLAMYDKNKIDITISAQRDHFKTAVKENLQNLKIALNEVDLIPVNIKLLDLKEENEKSQTDIKTEAFVNPYNNQNLTSVDIRV
ncbi:flagellar hook-length control protein FliK [Arcobacter peruensis]|uniref:flagellar hook-length control protein FliK n=1 Tax=Arcobacter peruensis TaxID=2320140 RepID=UPI000F076158|nr:flagellar hook-length control protein FliK [Arcobacter peruensis]